VLGIAGAVVGCWLAANAAAADPLLYEVRGNEIVFTNAPSRSDARPVPGIAYPKAGGKPRARTRAPLPRTLYDPFIEEVARENGIAPELIKAVAHVESGFNPHAISPKGAQGLMQLMPRTAKSYGVQDPYDPLQNLRAGAAHLRSLLDQFDGNVSLALAAYNAGAGAVIRHDGIPRFRETQDYVRKVHERMGRSEAVLPAVGRQGLEASPVPDVHMETLADGTLRLSN